MFEEQGQCGHSISTTGRVIAEEDHSGSGRLWQDTHFDYGETAEQLKYMSDIFCFMA